MNGAGADALSATAAAVPAPLIEVFWAVQGEGRFVGGPRAFVRVATCPIRCRYCDTPHSYTAPATVPVAGPGAVAVPGDERNPVSAARTAELVAAVTPAVGVPRVSVTGGEPLVFPAFVAALGRALRPRGFRLHLETAALDPEALTACVEQVDHLSADYKLPETLTAGHYAREHVQCCTIALAAGTTVDVKIVLTPAVAEASFRRALADLLPFRDRIVLILQPVTPFGAEPRPLPAAALQQFADAAGRHGFDLRVLPQVHRQLQVP